MAFWSRK